MAEGRSALEWSQTSALVATWGGKPEDFNPHIELERKRRAKERRKVERAQSEQEQIEANLRHVEGVRKAMQARGMMRG